VRGGLEKEVAQLQKDIEKNTVWLRDLDHKADRAMIEMSGLQEAINGIRERLVRDYGRATNGYVIFS
jgi:hypothetical protein